MDKPTVTYTDAAHEPKVGTGVLVRVIDHPSYLAGAWVRTSRVLEVRGERFETYNTRYIPGLRDPDPPRVDLEKIDDVMATAFDNY